MTNGRTRRLKKRGGRKAAAKTGSSSDPDGTTAGAKTTPTSTARVLAALASGRSFSRPRSRPQIRNAADIATQAHRERLVERAEAAFSGYERGRFQDALRAIKPVVEEAPSVAAVQEVGGLAG